MAADLFLALSLGIGSTFAGDINEPKYVYMERPAEIAFELNLVTNRYGDRIFVELRHTSDLFSQQDRGLNTIMLQGTTVLWDWKQRESTQ